MAFNRLVPLKARGTEGGQPVPRRLDSVIRKTRRLSVLGSTGSIGTQSLEVARDEGFEVAALAAGKNVASLAGQIRVFHPRFVSVQDAESKRALIEALSAIGEPCPEIGVGRDGLVRAAQWIDADTVVAAVTGFAGLEPVLAAASAGKKIALANKEALVVGGHAVTRFARESGALILPVDSEHSAIWQCLLAAFPHDLDHIILTCSGGPFFGKTREELAGVTASQALAHPTWSMGSKITIDSATLMNKAFEVLEACHLYGLNPEDVRVIIHPQSRVHSLVALKDGAYLAQLGPPDMRIPIRFALTFPRRADRTARDPFDLFPGEGSSWSFAAVDEETFPSIAMARRVWRAGGLMPLVMNAANEAAVRLFLDGIIPFTKIFDFVERALADFRYMSDAEEPAFDDMINGHNRVMEKVGEYAGALRHSED